VAPVRCRGLLNQRELPGFYASVVTGAFIGFLCALVDLAITKAKMELTLHELFLLTKGPLAISIASRHPWSSRWHGHARILLSFA